MENKRSVFNQIKSIFLNGLFALLPISLTVFLFTKSFIMIEDWLAPIQRIQPEFLRNIPHSEVILVILFIFLIGVILKFFILDRILNSIEESIFYRIPILRTFYAGIKQLVNAFSQQDHLTFNKVIILEFPKAGVYSIGFLTGEFPREIMRPANMNNIDIYYNVFIPTTPNPTTGYFIIAAQESFIEVDLSKQEAMAIIISGGIIKPERFKKSH